MQSCWPPEIAHLPTARLRLPGGLMSEGNLRLNKLNLLLKSNMCGSLTSACRAGLPRCQQPTPGQSGTETPLEKRQLNLRTKQSLCASRYLAKQCRRATPRNMAGLIDIAKTCGLHCVRSGISSYQCRIPKASQGPVRVKGQVSRGLAGRSGAIKQLEVTSHLSKNCG